MTHSTPPPAADLATANAIIDALRYTLREVTADRDELRVRLGDLPRAQQAKQPLFLEPAVLADGHWGDDSEEQQ